MSRRSQAIDEQMRKEKLLWTALSLLAASVLVFFLLRSCGEKPLDPVLANPNGKQIPVFPRPGRGERRALEDYEADRAKQAS